MCRFTPRAPCAKLADWALRKDCLPVEPDEEVPFDPSVRPVLPTVSTPPGVSAQQKAVLEELNRELGLLVDVSTEEKTLRRFEHVLAQAAPVIASRTGYNVVPLDSEEKFLVPVASLKFVVKTVVGSGKNAGRPIAKWSSVKELFGAIKYWHKSRDEMSVLETKWSKAMLAVWEGMEK